MAQIRQGFDTWGATRAHWRAYSLALLAEACGKGGNLTEGLAVLAEALTVVEQTGIRIYEPEMHRLKGEFLVALDPGNVADAEACFRQAVAIARRHQARSLELRATTSLARLWHRQGRGNEAQAALAAVYGTYTEGLRTPDLVEAVALLESLAGSFTGCLSPFVVRGGHESSKKYLSTMAGNSKEELWQPQKPQKPNRST
jgi:predicted ATPase